LQHIFGQALERGEFFFGGTHKHCLSGNGLACDDDGFNRQSSASVLWDAFNRRGRGGYAEGAQA